MHPLRFSGAWCYVSVVLCSLIRQSLSFSSYPGIKSARSSSLFLRGGLRQINLKQWFLNGKNTRIEVPYLEQFEELSDKQGVCISKLDVRGDSFSTLLGTDLENHPIIEILRDRRSAKTLPGQHKDKFKVGLAIEGGGMRGCISAGMASVFADLDILDAVDVVYGSSAGSLVGAYSIGRQAGMPRHGCSVYYDMLTGEGTHFIDTRHFLRALGLGAIYSPNGGLLNIFKDPLGRPILNLDYLLKDVVQSLRPLDWEAFSKWNELQPLKIIASRVDDGTSISMSTADGHFDNIEAMTDCMRASMLLPGLAGPVVSLPQVHGGRPLVDSQLFEPMPFRTALAEGCTHVIVLRTRPDGVNVCGKKSVLERLIMRRFFKRKHSFPEMYKYMKQMGHKHVYAKDILTLNQAANNWLNLGPSNACNILPISLGEGQPEIGRLERTRSEIYQGIKNGYAHAYAILSAVNSKEISEQQNKGTRLASGWKAVEEAFPNDVLDYEVDPIFLESKEKVVLGSGG